MNRRGRRYDSHLSLIDFLINVKMGLFLLLIVALAGFSIITKNNINEGIRPKAEYIITAEWATKINADVDLWVADPLGNIVYFQNKDLGLLHLDYDNLGKTNSIVTLNDGTTVEPDSAREVVSLRGIVPGEYVVNLVLYSLKDDSGMYITKESPQPVDVKVEIIRINPSVTVSRTLLVKLNYVGQEATAIRFTLDKAGNMSAENFIHRKLIK